MADEKAVTTESKDATVPEPRGFGEHSRGLASEYAHEQGWGLNEEERTVVAPGAEGGNDYEYGAQDFGDEAVDTSAAKPSEKEIEEIFKG